ncbi:MAG: hypothetical protein ABWY12_09760 [Burkholderiales bacterium]
MNYTQLRAAIAHYSENYEETFAEMIDTFIRQAENRCAHIVRLPPTRKNALGATVPNNRLLTPPSDYLAPDTLVIVDGGETWPLENKEPEFIEVCYPVRSLRARPRYYAKLDDTTLMFGPTPGSVYVLEISYFAYPPSIVTAGTSYLGNRCESLLLYACLDEACVFMKGAPEQYGMYDSRFKEATALFKSLGDGRSRKDSYEEPDRRVVV